MEGGCRGLGRAGQRRPGGSRKAGNIFPAISSYALTAKAPPDIKYKFLDDLQDAIDRTPASEVMLLIGDFNARVSKSTADNDEWRGVRGGHGVGYCNDAGEKFLEFCAVNNFAIMNAWFTRSPCTL